MSEELQQDSLALTERKKNLIPITKLIDFQRLNKNNLIFFLI